MNNIVIDPEFARLIPPQTQDEIDRLTTSCLKEGIRDALVVWVDLGDAIWETLSEYEELCQKAGQTLLDGHTRYRIAQEHGLQFEVRELTEIVSREEARNWIIDNQLGRRNLHPKAIALLLGKRYEGEKKAHGGDRPSGQSDHLKTAEKIAEQHGVSEKTVRRNADFAQAVETLDQAGIIDERDVLAGQSALTLQDTIELAEIARQDETKAKRLAQTVESGDAKNLTQARQVYARETRVPEAAVTPAMPSGKFHTIVLDPPWEVKKIEREERPNQGVELDYPTMGLDEIATLPVDELAEDACHLYLWVTQKYLPAGLELVALWGFAYQCILTWVKPTGMTPFSWMYNTEHVIYAHRGGQKLTQLGRKLSFEAPVQGHSVKPQVFYDRVIECSPGPRLEMFARTPREGFEVWGNEVSQ